LLEKKCRVTVIAGVLLSIELRGAGGVVCCLMIFAAASAAADAPESALNWAAT